MKAIHMSEDHVPEKKKPSSKINTFIHGQEIMTMQYSNYTGELPLSSRTRLFFKTLFLNPLIHLIPFSLAFTNTTLVCSFIKHQA